MHRERLSKNLGSGQHSNNLQSVWASKKLIEELRSELLKTQRERDNLVQMLQAKERELQGLASKQGMTMRVPQNPPEQSFKDLPICKRFIYVSELSDLDCGIKRQKISKDDWLQLAIAANQCYSNFTERLQNLYPAISEQEMHVCLLLKIPISPTGIMKLIGRSKQAITSVRKVLYVKFFAQSGTPAMWDEFIKGF